MLIIGLILFFGCSALLAYFMWTDHVEAIKSVVPGAKFLLKNKHGNPFLDDTDYCYVHAVTNGWVQYKRGQNGSPIHSLRVNDFIDLYIVENT